MNLVSAQDVGRHKSSVNSVICPSVFNSGARHDLEKKSTHCVVQSSVPNHTDDQTPLRGKAPERWVLEVWTQHPPLHQLSIMVEAGTEAIFLRRTVSRLFFA